MRVNEFSVIIPSYNRGELLWRAVASVLDGADDHREAIVVDDGSTDGGVAPLARHIGRPNLRVIRQQNQGATAARNRGAAEARCPWLVFLDDDDELAAHGLQTFREAMTSATVGVVCGAAELVDPEGAVRTTKRPRDLGPAYNDHRGLFLAGTFAVRRDVFAALGGFSTVCRANQHKEFALRLVPYCDEHQLEVATTDAVTVRVHEHSGDHLRSNMENLLEGSLYILQRHENQLRKSPRHFADWCSITGVYAAKLGRYALARRLFRQSLGAHFLRPSDFVRLALTCVPALAQRVWHPSALPQRDDPTDVR